VTYITEATPGRSVERWYARLALPRSTQKTHLTQKGVAPTCDTRTQKTHLTQKGGPPPPLNAFNAFNAYTQGEHGTRDVQGQPPLNAFNAFNAYTQGEHGTHTPATCAHARTQRDAGQTVCLDCGELVETSASPPPSAADEVDEVVI
jgi:hypothetical protein